MSNLLNCQNLEKSFGAQHLFSGISFGINSDEKIGLIGPNGSGKSTLLKILAELETPDKGEVILKRNTRVIYLAQDDQLDSGKTVEEVLMDARPDALEPHRHALQVQETIRNMNFADGQAPVETLSGGWRKRLSIAVALIQAPDILLIDEPTNHLDLEGILWLEDLLKRANFAFLLVSHDRYFLENCSNRIIELSSRYPEGFLRIEGNYSEFLRRREEFLHAQLQHEQSLSSKVRRELEWLSRGPKARTSKAKSRIDQAHELQQELRTVRSRNNQRDPAAIEFGGTDRKTRKLLEVKNLRKERGGKLLIDGLTLKLTPGFCLGILGANGSGKSTLLSLLNGSLAPDSGEIIPADDLRIVTFDQKREQLDPQISLKEALSPAGDSVVFRGQSLHVAPWAERFLFRKDQLVLPLSRLSGGEQARVLIANLMLQPADILMLDEPTNDLDIATLEVLEENLANFPGAIVLITHDRYLLERLSDTLLFLDGTGGKAFYADLDQWQAARQPLEKEAAKPKSKKKPDSAAAKSLHLSYEDRKELNKIEGRIQKAEAEVENIEAQLKSPEVASDAAKLSELYAELEAAQAKVEEIYARWEELETLRVKDEKNG